MDSEELKRLLDNLTDAIQSLHAKVDYIIECMGEDEQYDDADLSPFGRERDGNETL